jgi:hypothetical protein
MLLRASIGALMMLMAMPALAAGNVSSSLVKSGYFLAPDCTPTAEPQVFNECVCEASIKKAQVRGFTPSVEASINATLSLLPEKLAVESCEGTPTTAPKAGLKVNLASADYEVAYQSPQTLTVLVTYSTYGAGAEHPLDGTEGFTFDLASGQLVEPIAHLKPDALKKADAFIKTELLKKYPAAIYDEAKARAEPYLTQNGCDSCTLFYGKDGWIIRFQLTAIAPYMTGEPEIAIPADIIPPPEKLITKS